MGGCGTGGSTLDCAAEDDDAIEESLADCSVLSSASIITIVDVLVSTGPGMMVGCFWQGTRYRIGAEGAVCEVAMVAAEQFDLKVAELPFSSPRIPLISGHRCRVN